MAMDALGEGLFEDNNANTPIDYANMPTQAGMPGLTGPTGLTGQQIGYGVTGYATQRQMNAWSGQVQVSEDKPTGMAKTGDPLQDAINEAVEALK